MSIGTFTLIKGESAWIAAHILRILPYVDEMVFFDGGSTDGTIEIIEAIKHDERSHKIKLFKDKDPKDLKDDYVRLFNECMRSLSTDLAWFLHPDMWVVNPERILQIANSDAVALSTSMRSFAGEPGGQLYEIKGRAEVWKNIDRLHNPDLGAVYHGHYGAWNEGVYPTAIVGDSRHLHGNLDRYPYEVVDSGLEILHFSDVRSYERRLGRMRTCLENQGWKITPEEFEKKLTEHPRVTLKDGDGFSFVPAEYPAQFLSDRAKYSHLERSPELV